MQWTALFDLLRSFLANAPEHWYLGLPLGAAIAYCLDAFFCVNACHDKARHAWILRLGKDDALSTFVIMPAVLGIAAALLLLTQEGNSRNPVLIAGAHYTFAAMAFGAILYLAALAVAKTCGVVAGIIGGVIGWFVPSDNAREKKKQHAQLANEEKRRLAGADTQEEFSRLAEEIKAMAGDSALLAPLMRGATSLVKHDLPGLLKRRQYLLKQLPSVRPTTAQEPDSAEAQRNVAVAHNLELDLASIELTIARMRVSLVQLRPVIVESLAGLAGGNGLVESSLEDLERYSEAVRSSVAELRSSEDPLVAADRELVAVTEVAGTSGKEADKPPKRQLTTRRS